MVLLGAICISWERGDHVFKPPFRSEAPLLSGMRPVATRLQPQHWSTPMGYKTREPRCRILKVAGL
jgi:hypothetical protein